MHTFQYIISIFDSLTCVLKAEVNISKKIKIDHENWLSYIELESHDEV